MFDKALLRAPQPLKIISKISKNSKVYEFISLGSHLALFIMFWQITYSCEQKHVSFSDISWFVTPPEA
jgi:hypothetical protein